MTTTPSRLASGRWELTNEQTAEMHALYRHLHANPELSMQEHQTAAFITRRLQALGLETFACGGTGVGVPSVYWIFGGHTAERLASEAPVPGNHSPHFGPVMEPTLTTGVRAALTAILSKVAL